MEVRSQPAQQFHCHDLESGQSRIVVHGVLFLTHVVWVRLFLISSVSCLLPRVVCQALAQPLRVSHTWPRKGAVSEVQTETGRSMDKQLPRLLVMRL